MLSYKIWNIYSRKRKRNREIWAATETDDVLDYISFKWAPEFGQSTIAHKLISKPLIVFWSSLICEWLSSIYCHFLIVCLSACLSACLFVCLSLSCESKVMNTFSCGQNHFARDKFHGEKFSPEIFYNNYFCSNSGNERQPCKCFTYGLIAFSTGLITDNLL